MINSINNESSVGIREADYSSVGGVQNAFFNALSEDEGLKHVQAKNAEQTKIDRAKKTAERKIDYEAYEKLRTEFYDNRKHIIQLSKMLGPLVKPPTSKDFLDSLGNVNGKNLKYFEIMHEMDIQSFNNRLTELTPTREMW